PTCGAHLTLFTSLSPTTLDVTIATLDHPEQAPADRHIWVQSRLPWLHLDPQLPEEQQEQIP
ncbi:MAG TPA: GFA family protein, partial [Pseudomonas sp.]|nr:GFA family protein [Pseudomonas sp.]